MEMKKVFLVHVWPGMLSMIESIGRSTYYVNISSDRKEQNVITSNLPPNLAKASKPCFAFYSLCEKR